MPMLKCLTRQENEGIKRAREEIEDVSETWPVIRAGPNTRGKDWTKVMLELLAKQIVWPGFSRK